MAKPSSRLYHRSFSLKHKFGLSLALLWLAIALCYSGLLPLANLVSLTLMGTGLAALSLTPTTSHLSRLLFAALWAGCVLLGFFTAIFRPAGFHYPLVYDYSELDFSLFANFGKALAGYLTLLWLWSAGAKRPLPVALGLSLVFALAVIATAHFIFDLAAQPKWPAAALVFIFCNLAITVLAEEAFFRLLLQRQLEKLFPQRCGATWLALGISAAVFALAHAPPSHPAFALFLFAGGCYALVYTLTRRFSAALLTHWSVNVLHFTLLEYPLGF